MKPWMDRLRAMAYNRHWNSLAEWSNTQEAYARVFGLLPNVENMIHRHSQRSKNPLYQ